MNFADLHTRAALPLQFAACGLRLLPLTVGHARAIDALELWRPLGGGECILAAWICAFPPIQFATEYQSHTNRASMRFHKWRLGSKWDYAGSSAILREYFDHHLEEPVVFFKGSGSEMGTPWIAHMRAALCRFMHYAPETFDNQPIAQCLIDYHAIAELNGVATVKRQSVSEFRQAMEALS